MLEEKHNTESVTADALELLMYELNEGHVKSTKALASKISKMQWDHNIKINQKE